MRRFTMALGLAAVLAGTAAAPAAAQTITPASFNFGNTSQGTPSTVFTVTAGAAAVNGQPEVVSGDKLFFRVSTALSSIPVASKCDGSLPPGESCQFGASFQPIVGKLGSFSAVVGMSGGPTATVTGTNLRSTPGTGAKGKKSCKKKGKKSAAASGKKKGCKKKRKK